MEHTRTDACNTHYIAHQQAIVDAQKRIDKIEHTIVGMPQEIQFIKENVNKMCMSMERLIDRLETNYVSRELFESTLVSLKQQSNDVKVLCENVMKKIEDQSDKQISKDIFDATVLAFHKDIADVRSDCDKELKELKEQNKWLIRGLIAALLAAAKELILHIFSK